MKDSEIVQFAHLVAAKLDHDAERISDWYGKFKTQGYVVKVEGTSYSLPANKARFFVKCVYNAEESGSADLE